MPKQKVIEGTFTKDDQKIFNLGLTCKEQEDALKATKASLTDAMVAAGRTEFSHNGVTVKLNQNPKNTLTVRVVASEAKGQD